LAKLGKTPKKVEISKSSKPDSPIQSSHQGELKSLENFEDEKQAEDEVCISSPVATEERVKTFEKFKSGEHLKRILSTASLKDPIAPTK